MKKISIRIGALTGSFAENKDKAKALRIRKIIPSLSENKLVIIDFENVTGTTQICKHILKVIQYLENKGILIDHYIDFDNNNMGDYNT
jgi:chemotaxis regulatin CheY-phosphate phosphatase CheZ